MNPEFIEHLTDGYGEAVDSISNLAENLSELQETLTDSLSEMRGDIQALTSMLKMCLKVLQTSR